MKQKMTDAEIDAQVKAHMQRFFPDVIEDKNLKLSDLPTEDAPLDTILAFGRTIDKRGANPDHKKIGKLIKPLWEKYRKDGTVSNDIHVLRYLLYAEEARNRFWFLDKKSAPIWEQYLRDISSKVREIVSKK